MAEPQTISATDAPLDPLVRWGETYATWLSEAALPVWWDKGADHERGGFFERLHTDYSPRIEPRRAHLQARQACVFANAGDLGWAGPWRAATRHALSYLDRAFLRSDGFYRRVIAPHGKPASEEATLYDQAFILLAWASAAKAGIFPDDMRARAHVLVKAIESTMRYEKGGYREYGAYPYQSKAHAPLMDASLAWREIDTDPAPWDAMIDIIGNHCTEKLIDPDTMMLYDYYDADWKVLRDGSESTIHPGRHFLWSQLIARWAILRGDDMAMAMAQRLFEVGAQGVSEERNLTLDRYGADFMKCCDTARLWPQAERLRAAVVFASSADDLFRQFYLDNAASAAEALWRYVEPAPHGLWHDRMLADGNFADSCAPGTALYHLTRVVAALPRRE